LKASIIPACILSVAFQVAVALAQQPVAGGWAKADVAQKEVAAAAVFAVQAQGKTLADAKAEPPAKLELVEILGAEQQVVAGINYRLMLKVKLDGKEKPAEATVWWEAWRKPDPYQLTAWKWAGAPR